jgi:peroxiredoxin
MNRVLGLLGALCFALVLTGWSCGGESSDAKEESSAAARPSPAESAGSAEAYAALRQEIGQLQQSVTTQEKLLEAMELTITKLEKFIEAYPGSDEAKDADLQVAMIYSALSEHADAASHLEKFISGADEADERTGYANFYLAEAYKNLDRYDDAEKRYKVFIDKYGHLNPKFLAAANAALDDLPGLKRLAVGQEPIPFSVKDITGKPLSLGNYRGKVVLIDFWASWCMPCKVEMPNVVRIHKKYKDRGFEIIGISLDSDRKAFESYIKAAGMEWPQYFDGKGWQNEVADKYKVRAIPATFLVDKKGKIRYRTLRSAELEKAVERLLTEA